MLFNSWQFAGFFAVVYGLYLVLSHKWQNRLLLAASYIFYGTWNWRFLGLLLFTTALDYWIALLIKDSTDGRRRKLLLATSIAANLAVLGFFKYYNFFAVSGSEFLALLGVHAQPRLLSLILPWGISFYTFQSMSYTIDVYRGELVPASDFFDFSLFVTFFPHLVAGPIMRATKLLPQVLAPRKVTWEGFYEGCYLFFWGLFQKVFVADNLAQIVSSVFGAPAPYHGGQVLLGVYAFAFQIYGDFAGYSNMARGLGKMMGFEIIVNFNLPYFSTSPSEFWTRWHISLSSWLKDYLYIPLGGNRDGELNTYRNLMLTMLLGGLWHGANWTFPAWGLYHGLLLIAYRLAKPAEPRGIWKAVHALFFFQLTCLGWLVFRAQSLTQAWLMLQSVFAMFGPVPARTLISFAFYVALLLGLELYQYVRRDLLAIYRWPTAARAAVYLLCYLLLRTHGSWNANQFIYFQF